MTYQVDFEIGGIQKELINFSIGGSLSYIYDGEIPEYFQAEQGMTWTEWCNSQYYPSDFRLRDYVWIGGQSYSDSGYTLLNNGTTVRPSDVISADGNYTWED